MSKIQQVAAELVKRNLFAVVVPTADPHNSEYVASCFQRRAKLCGFKGSAGTCVVTRDDALLWTDGRYWLEAESSLEQGWRLMKQGEPGVPSIEEFLQTEASRLAADSPLKIGCDASTYLWSGWRRFLEANLPVVATEGNVIDSVLNEGGKPSVPPVVPQSVIALDIKYTGLSTKDKIAQVAAELTKQSADCTLLSDLSEVAWLLNMRVPTCCDIPFAPTFFAFAVVTSEGQCHVFMEKEKCTADALAMLTTPASSGVTAVHPYAGLRQWLTEKGSDTGIFAKFNRSAVLAETTASFDAYTMFTDLAKLRVRSVKCGIVEMLKAVKNTTELDGFYEAHRRDGVALTRYLSFMHNYTNAEAKKANPAWMTEVAGTVHLRKYREETGKEMFMHPSFGTISGADGNGAIIHYNCESTSPSTPITFNSMYLCDSGGQYYDGTTDVTRTVVFTTPEATSPAWKLAYTSVLKGHIKISSVVFPQGTTGHALDCLARMDLWKLGCRYAHGTGHGVGHCLNVHEGPHGITMLPKPSDPGLRPGMIVSNEPGFYVKNEFGIRIENLEAIREAPTAGLSIFGENAASVYNKVSCKCDSLTMVPLCRALLDVGILTPEEKTWINMYHQTVYKQLAPRVREFDDADSVLEYLQMNCAPI